MNSVYEDAYRNGYKKGQSDCDVFCVEPLEGLVAHAVVYGLANSVRRAKFPMAVDTEKLSTSITKGIEGLAKSGTGEGHDQWLTGVVVQFDLTLSNKAWVEAERYHFLDFVSSQSTMHRITRFDLDKNFNNYVDRTIVEIIKKKVSEYNALEESIKRASSAGDTALVHDLTDQKTEKYLEILYNNPAGFTLTAGMTTNYRQLKTIYKQRRNHRLPEWRMFCSWIETLPMSWLITGGDTPEGVAV